MLYSFLIVIRYSLLPAKEGPETRSNRRSDVDLKKAQLLILTLLMIVSMSLHFVVYSNLLTLYGEKD